MKRSLQNMILLVGFVIMLYETLDVCAVVVIGCYADTAESRDLSDPATMNAGNTLMSCRTYCTNLVGNLQ